MDESKQRAMVTKSSSSSIKRKPLANLTNILRKPSNTSSLLPSKKPATSDSSIGSTQNPINQHVPSKSQSLTPDRLAGDENQPAQVQRHATRNTRSTTKADVFFSQASLQERMNNVKQGYASFGSSTLGKIKDQGKINQSSTEKINDTRKSVDVPLSVTKNTNISTDKDKAKENAIQSNTVADVPFRQTSFHETKNNVKTGSACFGSSTFDKLKDQGKKINQSSTEKISNKRKSVDVPLSSHIMKSTTNNTDKDKGKENVEPCNTGLTIADDLMRRKDKGKAIAESPPSRKKLKNYMMDFNGPLKGVVIKERDGTDQRAPSKSQRLTPDCLAGEENQTVQAQKHRTPNPRSTTKVAVPAHQTSFQEKRNNVKQGSVSFCSSVFDKIKDQGWINESSTEKINDKRKTADAPLSLMKNTNTSTDRDKGKENVVQSNTSLTMADDLMKRKAKGKAIAESPDYPFKKKLKNYMMDFNGPLKGVVIKERDDTVTGSNNVSTPIKYHTLEKKKNQQISCPPILRTMNNRNDADVEEVFPSKGQTERPPNKKKRRCSAKEVEVEYKLPKEFVEEQRAYFKEIDDFELEVEEV